MSVMVYIAVATSLTLLSFLLWALRHSAVARRSAANLEEPERSNLEYFPQIHQALTREDREFLLNKGGAVLARTVDRERRGVALDFLKALEEEFDRQMRLARVIAGLSPEVRTLEEFERFRLNTIFHCRLVAVRMRLVSGVRPLPELNMVSDVVSGLTVRMETAMKELGERAALAAELASARDRSDVDFV